MRVAYQNSLEYRAVHRIKRIRSNVVLRRDLDVLGGSQSQITRVLSKLIMDRKLVKIGHGVYAKAYVSHSTNMVIIEGGTDAAFVNALIKLDVLFEPGSAEREYAAGLTTQIPAKKVIRLKSRCRRKISYGKAQLHFEGNINAK